MDPVPFDYRLFDAPAKQPKSTAAQSQPQSHYQYQHQRQTSTTSTSTSASAQNPAYNTNMSGGLSGVAGKIRSKAADTNSNSGSNLMLLAGGSGGSVGEFQCSSPAAANGVSASHIVQSGSYVEILKHTNTPLTPSSISSNSNNLSSAAEQHHQSGIQALQAAAQAHAKRGNAANSSSNQSSIVGALACHNKSYGDFLTITPRRKGKLLSASGYGGDKHSAGIAADSNNQDNYRHHLPTSIEPLHLLGIPNDNMSTFFDYRAMETLSNTETLAMGSSLAGYAAHTKSKGGGGVGYDSSLSCLNANSYGNESAMQSGGGGSNTGLPDEFHNIINEKNLSPPSAFSDNNSCLPKGKV